MRIHLEPYELRMAAQVGLQRMLSAMEKDRTPGDGIDPKDGWRAHIEGACGELAVAKALGRYWSGSVDTFRNGGDVGNLQVRTRSEEDYDLVIRNKDRDADYFFLVVGFNGDYEVVGYIRGSEGKQEKWFFDRGGRKRPCYWVPQLELTKLKSDRSA